MPEISILILMLLWLVSFFGISAFVMRIFQLKSETAPLVALSFLSVGLNLFGMIGWLQTAAFAFYLTGLAFFAYTAFKQKRSFLKLLLSPVSVVCLIWIVYLIVRLRNYLPYENDDLSHWALAAREILRTNAYPDASCEILSFSAYPLSSAVNIYYFCRFIGNHEWLYAFAQAFYRLIAFLPLLSLVRKNRVFGYVSFALGFLFISRAGGYIASLRVDPLLTAYGIGAFAAVLSSDTKKSRTLIALLPLMIMQTLTKNSGIFFAVTQALALALMVSKQSGKHQGLRAFLIGSGASAASLGIWLFYVSCVFSNGLSTKHAVSLSAYIHNALDKGLETTLKIARAFFGALCTPLPSDLMIYALFALALAFMGLMIRAFHKQKLVRPLLEMLGFLASVYVCYLLFLFGMYIVSMPEKEALAAASFTRYHRTITLYMGGCALAFVYRVACHAHIEMNRKRSLWIFSLMACLIVLGIVSISLDTRSGIILSDKQDRSERRRIVIRQKEAFGIEDQKAYLIFCAPDESETENNTDSIYYLYKYEFSSSRIGLIYESSEGDGLYIYHTYDHKRSPAPLDQILNQASDAFDYLIFHEADQAFIEEISALAPQEGLRILYPG